MFLDKIRLGIRSFLLNNKVENSPLTILTLILVNFVIRAFYLDSQSIAGDEPFSIYHAQMPVSDIINQLSKGNNPPLFEILLHFWIKLFGISAFTVRFLPLIFSVLNVLFIYITGKKFFNANVALISSLLYTFSNYSILFSHETRVYSLFGLLTSISFFSYLSIIRSKSTFYFIILSITNILLVYSHFLGFFVPLVQVIGCTFFREARKNAAKWVLLSILLLIIAYFPYIEVFITRLTDYTINGTWVPPAKLPDLYYMIWRFSNKPLNALVFGCIFIIAAWVMLKKRFSGVNTYQKLIFLWFLFPFIFMFLISFELWPVNFPVFYDRYLIFILPAFYLMVPVLIEYLVFGGIFKKLIYFVLVLLMVATVKPNVDNNRHVKETVSKIKELRDIESIVYLSPSWFEMNFVYYYNIECFMDYNPVDIKRNMYSCLMGQHIYPIDGWEQIDTIKLKKANRVIFLDAASEFSFPNNKILHTLKKYHTISNIYEYPEIFMIYVLEK